MAASVSGDSGAPCSRVVIPIGENISSRPLAFALTHSPFPKRKRDTQKDTPRRFLPRPLRPFDNYHNPIRSRRQSPQPSSAPRFSAIPHSAPYMSHSPPSDAPLSLCSLSEIGRPKLRVRLFHPNIIALCSSQIALWGSSPQACATLPRNQIRFPDAPSAARMRLSKSVLTSSTTATFS